MILVSVNQDIMMMEVVKIVFSANIHADNAHIKTHVLSVGTMIIENLIANVKMVFMIIIINVNVVIINVKIAKPMLYHVKGVLM